MVIPSLITYIGLITGTSKVVGVSIMILYDMCREKILDLNLLGF